MRDTFIVLGTCIASIALGAGLFFFLPTESSEPVVVDTAGQSADVGIAQAVDTSIGFVVIDAGDSASVSVRKNYAARDQESYLRIWRMAHGEDGTMPFPVDFSESYVIGVFMGQQSSGGYGIEVASITDRGDQRLVAVNLTSPGRTCVVTEALTSPYQFVVVPMSMNSHENLDVEVVTVCQ